jgi:peptidoglycan hydrolase CwlO-like protein
VESGIQELSNEVKALASDVRTLDQKVSGIDKRLDNQEFINRSLFVAIVAAFLGGTAKLFGWLPKT